MSAHNTKQLCNECTEARIEGSTEEDATLCTEQHMSTPTNSSPQESSAQHKIIKSIYRYTVQIAQLMEKSRITAYDELSFNPRRIIWINLLGGMARGIGMAIGFTIFTAIIVYILQYIGALNIPVIGDFIADIVKIVQHQLGAKLR